MKCPICYKILLESGFGDSIDYFCRTRIKFTDKNCKASVSHYANRDDGVTWYAPPYQITFKDGKSVIYILDDLLYIDRFNKPYFEYVFTIPTELQPDDPDKVAKRIKNLILFS